MELELLQGIIHRIGEYYLEKPCGEGDAAATTQSKSELTTDKALADQEGFLAARERLLQERNHRADKGQKKGGAVRKEFADSGYASLLQSGCNSNTGSRSPSPVPPDKIQTESGGVTADTRTKKWLVCQTGIIAVRVMAQEEDDELNPPNDQLQVSVEELKAQMKDGAQSKDDIVIQTSYGKKTARRERGSVQVVSPEPRKANGMPSKPTSGLVRVQMEESGEVLEVEAKYLEEAGPDTEVGVSDLPRLQVQTESEVLATLSHRFCRGEYQTQMHSSLISINPMRRTDSGCNRSGRRKHERKGEEDLPLLRQVEEVYRKAITTARPHSIILVGRSGSGKTCNFKRALAYLVETTMDVSTTQSSNFTMEKMLAVDCLLESFCSTRTCLNTHATRLAQLMQLHFNRSGHLQGAEVEMALSDSGRLLRTGRMAGEPTFPILYQVQAALGKSNLFLPPRMLTKNAFFTPLQDEVEIVTALEDWGRVCSAMEVVGLSPEEEDSFWIILAAITNLGYVATQLEESPGTEPDPAAMDKICRLLGVTPEEMKIIFYRAPTPRTASPASSIVTSSASSRASSPSSSPSSVLSPSSTLVPGLSVSWEAAPLPVENINRLAINLYSELLIRLVSFINRSIRPQSRQPATVLLFDSPGFQNPSAIGDKPAAGFVDLSYNYLQEKLQNLFSTGIIDTLRAQQKPSEKFFARRGTPGPILNLFERAGEASSGPNKQPRHTSLQGTRTLDRRTNKRVRFHNTAPGLFTLLHRAATCPWSDDQVFLQRLLAHWAPSCDGTLLEKSGDQEFVIKHFQGTNSVRYSVQGWRHLAHCMARTNLATELLRKTNRPELALTGPALLYQGIGLDRQALSLEEVKARMSCLQIQVQVEAIIRLLAGTEMSFVFCLVPHHLAGLCELFRRSPGRNLNQKLIRDQMRGCQILDFLEALQATASSAGAETAANLLLCDAAAAGCLAKSAPESAAQRRGLAAELWQGLQIAVLSTVVNLESLESLVSTMTRTVSLSTPNLAQVLDSSGLLLLENGRLTLNVESLLLG